jgi:hypothetical protein
MRDSNKVSGKFDIHDCPEEEKSNGGSGEDGEEVLHDMVKRVRPTSDTTEKRLKRMFPPFRLQLSKVFAGRLASGSR